MRSVLLALVGGCGTAWQLPASLDIEGPNGFTQQVLSAAQAWDTPLHDCPSGPPFVFGDDDGHPVVLVADSAWADRTVWGWEDEDRIEIHDRSPVYPDSGPAIVHELGHALGLDHMDPMVDPMSVMMAYPDPRIKTPSTGDVARARALLGCR